MAKKKRADSVLDKLPPNQRATLEGWLFTDNLSYTDAVKKLWEDFNVRVAPSSLSSFWQECSQRRMLSEIATSSQDAHLVVDAIKANAGEMSKATSALIARIAFEESRKGGGKMNREMIVDLTRLAMKERELAIKEAELSLAREKFEFDAAKAALKELPALRKIASDNSLNDQDKLTQVRLRLFGSAPA